LASIQLENVTVEYPVDRAITSFRTVLKQVTGGLIKRGTKKQRRAVVRALEGITLNVQHGDRLGIVGHNGAGKSTLLKVCAGVLEPSGGSIRIDGQVSPLLTTSPGLDADDTGYDNIQNCGLFLGMTPEEIARKTPEIEDVSELGEYLQIPIRAYSAGMTVRLGFAIATSIDPQILILDEGLGAGDARFAERAKQRVDALISRSNILILASHSETMIRNFCNRAILLNAGRLVVEGTVDEVFEAYNKKD
jgi:ABC-type polysaccharide/polyol phosphate transport system ATPase subunit